MGKRIGQSSPPPIHSTLCQPMHTRTLHSLLLPLLLALNATASPLAALPSSSSDLDAQNGIPAISNNRSTQPNDSRSAKAAPWQEERADNQPSAFASYAHKVTGTRLAVFGSSLFMPTAERFTPQENAQVSADYIVGPGDELQIRGWGMVDIDWNATVDRNGNIYIPRVGSIGISGVSFGNLPAHLKQALGRVFTNFDLSVSIAKTHALHIYVVGHAAHPGSYTLHAMSSVLSALFRAGGPSGSGSMRDIRLLRSGKEISRLDLYDLLIDGDKSRDPSLQDGDVIRIPAVGPQIALSGTLKRPGIYELKEATDLQRAIDWAGGFSSSAARGQIIIEKEIRHQFQTIAELPEGYEKPDAILSAIPLAAADVIRVLSPGSTALAAAHPRQFVQVAGEVQQPGIYQISQGETLRELIQRLGGTTAQGYLFAMRFERESLRREQQQMLNTLAERYSRDIETIAARKSAGISDPAVISAQNTELERMRQLAQKLKSATADGRIILELESAQTEPGQLPALPLQDGDSIVIPKRPDTVSVLGAVFQASTFMYRDQQNAADYLELAGGPSATASPSELYIIRADGTVRSQKGKLSGLTRTRINPGDAIVVPEKIERSNWIQSLKDWTTILYQFGLGVAGIKILRN
jgi:polysaccharide export outer membrane protein